MRGVKRQDRRGGRMVEMKNGVRHAIVYYKNTNTNTVTNTFIHTCICTHELFTQKHTHIHTHNNKEVIY